MTHAHSDSAANASCPTCQGTENMRRQIETEADARARERFRTFVALYLTYPAIILTLLGVIGVGAYMYVKGGTIVAEAPTGPEPSWCYPGNLAGYVPTARPTSDGIEPAIPPGGALMPTITPQIGIPNIAAGVQAAGISARERIAYYVYVSIRAADGAQDARYQRNMIGLSQVEMGVARQQFVERSRKDGRLGFIRLGITQLGGQAYDVAQRHSLTVPFCRPNDFATPDKRQAYVHFAVASYCDTAGATRANDWLVALAAYEGYSNEQIAAMQAEAASYLASDPQACLVQIADEQPPQLPGEDPEYEEEDAGALGPSAGLQGSREKLTPEELAAARAREHLNRGDAELNNHTLRPWQRVREARQHWQRAINAGRRYGAQASIVAQKRIQTHTLTCHPNDETVRSISRDYEKFRGDLINPRAIQRALRALGHYDGPLNGHLGPMTRASIRKFQREMAFDETDTLTPMQTVYVVCNAAQIARDPSSQNVLGIMYATGLGVKINVDLALEWLRAASSRRHAESTYHLAVIYGTGIVLNSYRLCDIAQNLDQADEYLREAANQGYPPAINAWERHAGKSQAARWAAIKDEMLKNTTFANASEQLKPIGKSCLKVEETSAPPAEPQGVGKAM